MKKLINLAVIISILLPSIFQSCSKSNETKQAEPVNISATVVSGSWKITSYTQRDESKTSDYQGYTFSFTDAGLVKATGRHNLVQRIQSRRNRNA